MIPRPEDLDPAKFVDVDIFGPDMKTDPARHFVDWATRPPFYVVMGGVPNGVITRHADVKRAFHDYELFSIRPPAGQGGDELDYFNSLPNVGDQDPPTHTKLRRLMQPAFTPQRLSRIESDVYRLVDTQLATLADRDGFEVMSELAHPLSAAVLLGAFLDIAPEDWAIFTRFSRALELVPTVPPGAPKPKAYMEAYDAGRAYCERMIQLRRAEPKNDLIGDIIAAEEGGSLTTEELYGTLIVLQVAGLGSLASFIGQTTLRFCRHPDQLAILQADPTLVPSALEEVLRIDANGNFRHRYVTRDCLYEGLPLFEGMRVHISMAAPGYDPALYPDPTRFDVRRNPKQFMTFGFGVHFCIGQPIIRMVGKIAITKLIEQFPRLRFATRGFEPAYVGVPTERQPAAIPVRVD